MKRLTILTILSMIGFASWCSAATLVTFPNATLEKLLGPLSLIEASADPTITAYDNYMLSGGLNYANTWPENPGDLPSSNFYDLAYVLYQIYYRTGDPAWLTRARQVATDWRDQPNIQSLHTCVEQTATWDWGLCAGVMAARNMSLMGLAVLGVENNDLEARTLVDLYAKFIQIKSDELFWDDPRENGYKIMALAAAVELGYPHQALANTMLNTSLSHQQPNGSWTINGFYNNCSYSLPENFMLGLLGEGLMLYDRVIGDARIVPALQLTATWLWSTQWQLADTLGFVYAPPESTCIQGGPAHVLNGMFLPIWAYLYMRTGDPLYQTQGHQILQGLVQFGFGGSVKQFNQAFRSSAKLEGSLATTAGPPGPTLSVSPATVAPGATLTVTLINGPGAALDWLALYPTSAPADTGTVAGTGSHLAWAFLNDTQTAPATGLTTATVHFTMPLVLGAYHVRFYANNGFTVLTTSPTVQVSAPGPAMSVSPDPVAPGGIVTVSLTNGPGSPTDWMALYPASAPVEDGSSFYLAWNYLNDTHAAPAVGLTDATVHFTMSVPAGLYHVRLFASDTVTLVATSPSFLVQPNPCP
jgi:hypothetical protein